MGGDLIPPERRTLPDTVGQPPLPRAFGLELQSELALPGSWETSAGVGGRLVVSTATNGDIETIWSGPAAVGWSSVADDLPFEVVDGVHGDRLMVHGSRGRFHLDSAGQVLRCSGTPSPEWWRVVLDSVLFTAGLVAGREAIHAASVRLGGRTVAITGPSGTGKSTLLRALLRAGGSLVADDVTFLEPRDALPPLALAGPPVMTVPRREHVAPEAILLELAEERWITEPAAGRPVSLTTVVQLRRSADEAVSDVEATRWPATLGDLLGLFLRYPDDPPRERARFELAAVLAQRCDLITLSAPLAATPERLAQTLLAVLT